MSNSPASQCAVLVVEDDQLLKMLTVDLVEHAGFVALQADNADRALDILAARPDIAILLTDVNMPGSMDGLKLAHVTRGRWPLIKIIVASARADLSDADLPGGSHLFRKPYHADAMIAAIHAMSGSAKEFPGRPRFYLDV